jgi:hypothetical protein
MITSHLSSIWALLATFVVGFVLGAVVQAACAKWKRGRELRALAAGLTPIDDEEFGMWRGKGLPPGCQAHLRINSELNRVGPTPRNRRK